MFQVARLISFLVLLPSPLFAYQQSSSKKKRVLQIQSSGPELHCMVLPTCQKSIPGCTLVGYWCCSIQTLQSQASTATPIPQSPQPVPSGPPLVVPAHPVSPTDLQRLQFPLVFSSNRSRSGEATST